MFECTYKSREREEALLRRFLRCIDDMKDYLDEYDECFGLAQICHRRRGFCSGAKRTLRHQ